MSLVRDGSIWIIPRADGSAEEGFRASEVIPASKVALLYPLLQEIVGAGFTEAMRVLAKRKSAGTDE